MVRGNPDSKAVDRDPICAQFVAVCGINTSAITAVGEMHRQHRYIVLGRSIAVSLKNKLMLSVLKTKTEIMNIFKENLTA
jgi:hypothetical protein